MNKSFEQDIERLFSNMVSEKTTQKHTGTELLDILKNKANPPICAERENCQLRLTYYNVSLDLREDLSNMVVSYNSDYSVKLHPLSNVDLFQLTDFILALERDIPKWKHIWMTEDELEKTKARMERRLKASLREIRHAWTTSEGYTTEDQENEYRVRFFNIKAAELMLRKGCPYWENKKTEADIFDQFNILHIEPPMEEWLENWLVFCQACEQIKTNRKRRQEEYKRNLMKMRHLINIKMLKINAFIRTIELCQPMSVTVHKHFNERKIETTKYGYYQIVIRIDNANVRLYLTFDQVDECLNRVIHYIKKINNVMPELRRHLLDDSQNNLQIISNQWISLLHPPFEDNPLHIATQSGDCLLMMKDLVDNSSLCNTVDLINKLLKELLCYLHQEN